MGSASAKAGASKAGAKVKTELQDSEWAREVLDLGTEELTKKKLSAAYRRKAREVHPDKQLSQAEKPQAALFHEVTAAYEALLPSVGAQAANACRSVPEVPRKGPRSSAHKRGKRPE